MHVCNTKLHGKYNELSMTFRPNVVTGLVLHIYRVAQKWHSFWYALILSNIN